jgi:hypothetical protein
VRVILDTNVWSYLGDEGSRQQLDAGLRQCKATLLHTPSVLLEVLRTPNVEVRQRIVRAMVVGLPVRKLPSEAEAEAQEVTEEIQRVRPEWLLLVPDLRRADQAHRFWTRRIWNAVERDLDGFVERSALLPLPDVDEHVLTVQRERKAAIRESRDSNWTELDIWAEPTADASTEYLQGWPADQRVEAWRVATRDVFWEALKKAPLRRVLRYEDTTYADFVGARVDLEKMTRDGADFTTFFFDQVELAAMRRCWLRWATDFAQGFTKVTPGNPRDAQHAAYLVDCDLFVTADARYARTMATVAAACPFAFAAIALVRREEGQTIADAVIAAVSEQKAHQRESRISS